MYPDITQAWCPGKHPGEHPEEHPGTVPTKEPRKRTHKTPTGVFRQRFKRRRPRAVPASTQKGTQENTQEVPRSHPGAHPVGVHTLSAGLRSGGFTQEKFAQGRVQAGFHQEGVLRGVCTTRLEICPGTRPFQTLLFRGHERVKNQRRAMIAKTKKKK